MRFSQKGSARTTRAQRSEWKCPDYKVPLLGDLPILGKLFKFEGESTVITELVVFITPKIVTKPVLTDKEQEAFDVTEFEVPKSSSTKAEENLEK